MDAVAHVRNDGARMHVRVAGRGDWQSSQRHQPELVADDEECRIAQVAPVRRSGRGVEREQLRDVDERLSRIVRPMDMQRDVGIDPFQMVRSVFSLCGQIALRQSWLAMPTLFGSPVTRIFSSLKNGPARLGCRRSPIATRIAADSSWAKSSSCAHAAARKTNRQEQEPVLAKPQRQGRAVLGNTNL